MFWMFVLKNETVVQLVLELRCFVVMSPFPISRYAALYDEDEFLHISRFVLHSLSFICVGFFFCFLERFALSYGCQA